MLTSAKLEVLIVVNMLNARIQLEASLVLVEKDIEETDKIAKVRTLKHRYFSLWVMRINRTFLGKVFCAAAVFGLSR